MKRIEFPKYRSRVVNFFYGFIQKRQLGLWKKIPRSQMRLYMFLLQNGNSMSRSVLVDKLVEIGYSANRNAAKAAYRRGLDSHVLIENDNKLSVAEPVEFVIKFGSIYDNWRIFMIPTSILSLLFLLVFNDLFMTTIYVVLNLILIIIAFVSDFFNTVKY